MMKLFDAILLDVRDINHTSHPLFDLIDEALQAAGVNSVTATDAVIEALIRAGEVRAD